MLQLGIVRKYLNLFLTSFFVLIAKGQERQLEHIVNPT